jgi:hypothetical protein
MRLTLHPFGRSIYTANTGRVSCVVLCSRQCRQIDRGGVQGPPPKEMPIGTSHRQKNQYIEYPDRIRQSLRNTRYLYMQQTFRRTQALLRATPVASPDVRRMVGTLAS